MIRLTPETEALARLVAEAQSVSIEDAIRKALQVQAQDLGVEPVPAPPRDRSPEAIALRRARMDQIVREIAVMPLLDPRSPSEIVDDVNT